MNGQTMQTYRLPEKLSYETYGKTVKQVLAELKTEQAVSLDLAGVRLDSVTRALIRRIHEAYPETVLIDPEILAEVCYQKTDAELAAGPREMLLDRVGDWVIDTSRRIHVFFIILVDMLYYSFQAVYNRTHIVKNDTTKNVYYIGYKAIPIVCLLAFLIGLTISIQSAIQMAKFGGQGYIAMLIGVAMLRELGPLITAIIIAGRTGSAIAAEIGTMSVMEEVDALMTMGVKPLKFLLVPKFWAFTVSMPVLTLLASFAGIFGGLLVATIYSVPPSSFVSQLISIMKMSDIYWGVLKSLTFAWVILAVACYKGLNVRGGADAVGRATTESVVVSIFMVVVIDAVYSLFLYT